MGSPTDEKGRWGDETLHRVTLTHGFWLAETTVTQVLWQTIMGANPRHFKGDNRPVETVSWDDAQTFLDKLNQIHPDLSVRLPWEAEWEYACRAGTQTPFNFGEELTLDNVNYRGTWDYKENEWGEGAKKSTADVKTYPCNAWGLYEMHGNVWEWCQDVWQEKLPASPVIDPEGIAGGDKAGVGRVVRGGSWNNNGRNVRSAIRSRDDPANRDGRLGLRFALGLELQPAQQCRERPCAKLPP
ncbi:formylglycine-generating enzyme family protein [Thiothrix lacustris]|uniref:formylglycine-generating enzyme family protein n=1 Tax=Thiothrix lacustris TaxID=525917 RepID=UPI001FE181FF|nr:formylglycine-generating enzyme family protein [Thiothrix lacustris]